MTKQNSPMWKVIPVLFFLLILNVTSHSQSYTRYFNGDTTDVTTKTQPGTVLMGGATENDNAMKWFLEHSGGGDIVIIRASGSDGYNDYLYSELGIPVNSVETIVFKSGIASHDSYVIRQIRNAEALWIAGGDQWDYVSYWKSTPVNSAINYLINEKHIPVGGTSAGMAVLGTIVNTAQNGSVSSSSALMNPYDPKVKLLNGGFISNPILQDVITDTHYDNPDRRGRHIVFMARILTDTGYKAYGIACEEYTAICIDESGIGFVYGNYPSDNDYALFLQPNCVNPIEPETCVDGQPLTWDRNHEAVKVYKVPGTQTGSNWFDLNDWVTGEGGTWENWYVTNGVLHTAPGANAPECTTGIEEDARLSNGMNIHIFPSPANEKLNIELGDNPTPQKLIVYDVNGMIVTSIGTLSFPLELDVSTWKSGLYCLVMIWGKSVQTYKIVKY